MCEGTTCACDGKTIPSMDCPSIKVFNMLRYSWRKDIIEQLEKYREPSRFGKDIVSAPFSAFAEALRKNWNLPVESPKPEPPAEPVVPIGPGDMVMRDGWVSPMRVVAVVRGRYYAQCNHSGDATNLTRIGDPCPIKRGDAVEVIDGPFRYGTVVNAYGPDNFGVRFQTGIWFEYRRHQLRRLTPPEDQG